MVIFTLGQEEYALPIGVVREITSLSEVRAIPQAPHYVRGLINLRGMAIPLIDLHVRFGINSEKESTFALITEVQGNPVGFAVDEVREVRILENVSAPPSIINASFIDGIVNFSDRIILTLIPEKILAEDEVEGLMSLLN